MEKEKLVLRECPFCKSNNLAMVEVHNDVKDCDDYCIECNCCLAQGGLGIYEDQAKFLWNLRLDIR